MQNGNLAGVDDILAFKYGITDDVVQAIQNGKEFALPMQPNLLGEAASLISKKLRGKDVDVSVSRNIVKGMNKVKAIFNPNASDNLFTGIIGAGGDLRMAIPRRVSRFFDLAPGSLLTMKNIGESTKNLDGIMKAARFSREARNKYMKEMLDTESHGDMLEILRNVYADMADKIIERNPKLEDFRTEVKETMDFLADESDLKRYLTAEDTGKQLAYPGVKYKIKTKTKNKYGKEETVWEATPTAQQISEYVDNYIPIIDYTEVEAYFPILRQILGPKKSAKRQYLEQSIEPITDRFMARLKLAKRIKPDPRTGRMTPKQGGVVGMLYQDLLLQRLLKPS